MRWARTTVNVDNHVIIPDLDAELENPKNFVEDYISHMTTQPLDLSKPLWELHLLNVKTSEAEAVGVLRIHHSIGDGASLISLLLACTRKTRDPEALPSVPVQKNEGPGGRAKGVWWVFLAIWSGIMLIWNSVVDLIMFSATTLFLKDTKTPLKGDGPGNEHAPKRFVHRTLDLEDIKLVKNAMNMVCLLFPLKPLMDEILFPSGCESGLGQCRCRPPGPCVRLYQGPSFDGLSRQTNLTKCQTWAWLRVCRPSPMG